MADRQTRVLGGNGTSVQAFTLDPGLLQYVQSVHVKIDNSGGGDISPTLTVQTNNGVDIAKKEQGRPIPAGDSGSATWALRLDDESNLSRFIRYLVNNVGGWLNVTAAWDNYFASAPVTQWQGEAAILFSSLGAASYIPVVLRASQDGGLTWTEFGVGTSGAAVYHGDLDVYDDNFDVMAHFGYLGSSYVRLRSGFTFQVLDRNANPIFQVDEDGALHGLTGQALTFDL